jgi:hypothetical protein
VVVIAPQLWTTLALMLAFQSIPRCEGVSRLIETPIACRALREATATGGGCRRWREELKHQGAGVRLASIEWFRPRAVPRPTIFVSQSPRKALWAAGLDLSVLMVMVMVMVSRPRGPRPSVPDVSITAVPLPRMVVVMVARDHHPPSAIPRIPIIPIPVP